MSSLEAQRALQQAGLSAESQHVPLEVPDAEVRPDTASWLSTALCLSEPWFLNLYG